MNRWRQRLAELHGDGAEKPPALRCAVQNVQNVQNPPSSPSFERFEQIEQPTEPAARAAPADPVPATCGVPMEERVAIIEHDGAIPRVWAESFARLDPDRPPSDVPLRRWQRFIDDVRLFLDGPFCAVASPLGWTSFDPFCCDCDRPFARIDRCGLVWLIDGDRLVMLAENTATIETRTGARQTWRRKPGAPGRVLAWELVQ
jgi:hypothetical protein